MSVANGLTFEETEKVTRETETDRQTDRDKEIQIQRERQTETDRDRDRQKDRLREIVSRQFFTDIRRNQLLWQWLEKAASRKPILGVKACNLQLRLLAR